MSDHTVMVVDDDDVMRDSLVVTLEDERYRVSPAAGVEQARHLMAEVSFDLALVDVRMGRDDGVAFLGEIKQFSPSTEVVVITAYATVPDAVQAIKAGAYDYLAKPFSSEDLLLVVERALERKNLSDQVHRLELQLRLENRFEEIVGRSAEMTRVLSTVARAARVQSTVLVMGETGTGKELVARAIHRSSERRDRPLVTINCGAIPETLQESELFGHIKGAFTDARRDRNGLLVEAAGGTLFLDEIGDMAPSTQVKLLRFLQDGEVRPVGSDTSTRVDTRVICATDKDLKTEVREGRFREDLFYRVSVIEIALPALRERRDDIAVLANHLVAKCAARLDRKTPVLGKRVVAVLESYHWPGNVRELENVIERVLVMSQDEQRISLEDLPPSLTERGPSGPGSHDQTLAAAERAHILAVLREAKGNQARASTLLGIAPSTLWRKLKDYDVDPAALR